MSNPSVPLQPARKRRGCLKGCLAFLLVGAILLVGLGVAGYVYLVPYLKDRSAELQVQYPWLGPAWEVLSGMAGQSGSEVLGSRSGEKRQGESDRSLLPSDIPVLEDAYREAFSITPSEVTVYQISSYSQELVSNYFTENFRKNGWQSGRTITSGGMTSSWTKGESVCLLDVLEIEGRVEVFLRCRVGER